MATTIKVKGKSTTGGPKKVSKTGIKDGKISSKAKLKLKIKEMLRSGSFSHLSRKGQIK